MSDRERWIVYPILFFSLMQGFKASYRTDFPVIECKQLLVKSHDGKTRVKISGLDRKSGSIAVYAEGTELAVVEAGAELDQRGARGFIIPRDTRPPLSGPFLNPTANVPRLSTNPESTENPDEPAEASEQNQETDPNPAPPSEGESTQPNTSDADTNTSATNDSESNASAPSDQAPESPGEPATEASAEVTEMPSE